MRTFAMLGKWHVHAEGYAKELNALPGCAVAAVWDEAPQAADAWARELGCRSVSLEEIFSDADIEGVVLGCATSEHPALLLRACAARKAVFTEKVLTLRSEDAEAVREAVRRNGTRFAISFPHHSEPSVIFALQTAASGKLGQLNYARVRKVHNGSLAGWLPEHFYDPAACGGGAMIDLGAHPMYLLCALLGEPERVQSEFTRVTGRAVEDNAVSLLRFARGAVGVAETGFVSLDYPFTMELGGTEGSLLLRDDRVQYCCAETGHVWAAPAALPDARPSPLAQWALAERPEDVPAEIGIDAAVRLTRVMEMAYQGR